MKTIDATKVKSWLTSKAVSPELKATIKKMSTEHLKQAFSKQPLEFGTAGIRGKMGPGTHQLNEFVYQQMTIGFCKYLLQVSKKAHPKIIIGHDNRIHSAEFALACAKAANEMGVDVALIENNELIPTPILSYAIRAHELDGGINVTASHNPKEDNGFKAYNKVGAQILPDEAKIIIKNMPHSKDILNLAKYYKAKNKGAISYLKYNTLVNHFFDEVIKKTNIDKTFLLPRAPIKNIPIVFTGFHGTTTELVPTFLRKLGFKKVYVYPYHANISGEFEDCPISNPENPKAFDDVLRYAIKVKATIVIGCDPDGDRMAIGFKKTNRWRFLNGNEMGVIFAHYILNRKQFTDKTPLIITTHVSTSYIDRVAKRYHAEVKRTKTGFKWMSNMIDNLPSKYQFILGFEEAIGSLTHTVCRDKDAFGAILLALEIYDQGNAYFPDLHDYLCDRLYDIYGPTHTQTISYTLKGPNWKAEANKLMNRARHYKERKLFDYEIKKIWFEKESDCVVWTLNKDSWIKFRLSGTEPKFKVYINFHNQMAGQLKAAATVNISRIEKIILKDISYTK
ncbi:MAG: phospho-sugar mutase [Mycoplasmoidaceae bacterium]